MKIKEISFQQTWHIRHNVMWPSKPIDYIKLPNDEKGIHFGLFVQNKLVSVVSGFIENDKAQFRKFATIHSAQGKGYGSKLLSHLITTLEKQPIIKIWCNARINTVSFYNRFEMKKTDTRFSKDGIDYIIMEKTVKR